MGSEREIVDNYDGSVAAGGVIVTFAGIAIIHEAVIIVLRLLNACSKQINFLFIEVRSYIPKISY